MFVAFATPCLTHGSTASRCNIRRSPIGSRCCADSNSQRDDLVRVSANVGVCHGPTCSVSGGGVTLLDTMRLLLATAQTINGKSKSIPVSVDACGCLGQCSPRGGNVGVASLSSKPTVHTGIRTVTDMSQLMLQNQICSMEPNPKVFRGLLAKEQGNQAFTEGNHELAIQHYNEALHALSEVKAECHVPEIADRIRAGILANRSGAWVKSNLLLALEDANAAIDLRPDLISAWRRKGDAEEGLGNRDAAAQAIEIASKLEPSETQRKALKERVKRLKSRGWRLF